MIFPVFPCSLPHNKNRLSILSTSLTLSAINFCTDAVLKVAVRAPCSSAAQHLPRLWFLFLLMRRGKIPAGCMRAVGGAERFIFAELESNVFITQFTAEHSKGPSGRESKNNTFYLLSGQQKSKHQWNSKCHSLISWSGITCRRTRTPVLGLLFWDCFLFHCCNRHRCPYWGFSASFLQWRGKAVKMAKRPQKGNLMSEITSEQLEFIIPLEKINTGFT